MSDLPEPSVSPCQFFGEFRLKIDAKGRLTLPASHRKALSNAGVEAELVVRRASKDSCLQLIPKAEFLAFAQQRRGQSSVDGETLRRQQRALYSQSEEAALDLKGRMAISRERLSAAGIQGDAILVGVNRILELWEPQAYLADQAEQAKTAKEVDDLLFYE